MTTTKPGHVTEILTWASNAKGPTYAARCSCGWLGKTRDGVPDNAKLETIEHLEEA